MRLSVQERRLDLLVEEAELARRRALWQAPPAPKRGWDKLVHEQVLQAPEGADLAFLRPEGRLRHSEKGRRGSLPRLAARPLHPRRLPPIALP